MKITLSVEEAKLLLNCLYGHQCVANMHPAMPEPELKTLSSEEVHNEIVAMCVSKSVTLYINNIKMYQSKEPDYDEIAEFLIPYDDEIVSMKEIKKHMVRKYIMSFIKLKLC